VSCNQLYKVFFANSVSAQTCSDFKTLMKAEIIRRKYGEVPHRHRTYLAALAMASWKTVWTAERPRTDVELRHDGDRSDH